MMQKVERESQRKANEWTNFDMLTVTKAIMKWFFFFDFALEWIGECVLCVRWWCYNGNGDRFEKLFTEIEKEHSWISHEHKL